MMKMMIMLTIAMTLSSSMKLFTLVEIRALDGKFQLILKFIQRLFFLTRMLYLAHDFQA